MRTQLIVIFPKHDPWHKNQELRAKNHGTCPNQTRPNPNRYVSPNLVLPFLHSYCYHSYMVEDEEKYYYNTNSDGSVEKISIRTGKVVELYRTQSQALSIAQGKGELVEVKIGDEVFKTDPMLMDQGLPSNRRYNEIVAGIILAMVSNGSTLSKALAKPGMPTLQVVTRWMTQNEGFHKAINQALRFNSYRYFDKVDEIATDLSAGDFTKNDVEAKKAAIDGFKWLAEKSDPERLGVKKEAVHSGGLNVVINTGVPPKEDIEDVEYENIGEGDK